MEMTTEAKTYNKRFNAQRAAKAVLGKDAIEGRDFTTAKAANGEWAWTESAPADEIVTAAIADAGDADDVTVPAARKPRAARVDESGAPVPPDFSANTHRNWRKKLAAVTELATARDVAALKAFALPAYSSSPKAIARYRDAVVAYLETAA